MPVGGLTTLVTVLVSLRGSKGLLCSSPLVYYHHTRLLDSALLTLPKHFTPYVTQVSSPQSSTRQCRKSSNINPSPTPPIHLAPPVVLQEAGPTIKAFAVQAVDPSVQAPYFNPAKNPSHKPRVIPWRETVHSSNDLSGLPQLAQVKPSASGASTGSASTAVASQQGTVREGGIVVESDFAMLPLMDGKWLETRADGSKKWVHKAFAIPVTSVRDG